MTLQSDRYPSSGDWKFICPNFLLPFFVPVLSWALKTAGINSNSKDCSKIRAPNLWYYCWLFCKKTRKTMGSFFPCSIHIGLWNFCLENNLSSVFTAGGLQLVVTSPQAELFTFIPRLKLHILSNILGFEQDMIYKCLSDNLIYWFYPFTFSHM